MFPTRHKNNMMIHGSPQLSKVGSGMVKQRQKDMYIYMAQDNNLFQDRLGSKCFVTMQ